MYASTVWEICRNCGGATFHLLCLGVQHVIETPHPPIPLGFFFSRKYGSRLWRAWWKDPSGYIPNGKKETAANGLKVCWLIIAGHLYRRQQQNTAGHLYGRHQQNTAEHLYGRHQQNTAGHLYGRHQQNTDGHLYGRHQQNTAEHLCGRHQQNTAGHLYERHQQNTAEHLYRRHQQNTTGHLYRRHQQNTKIHETKDDKTSFWCYIYKFLGRILCIDKIFKFWTVYSNFKIY